jgi:hypothetical protein
MTCNNIIPIVIAKHAPPTAITTDSPENKDVTSPITAKQLARMSNIARVCASALVPVAADIGVVRYPDQ